MQPYSNEYDTLMSVVRSMISDPILMTSLWIEREPSLSYLHVELSSWCLTQI